MNILTPDGYKPIEDIAVGDEVVAWDFFNGVQEVNTVEEVGSMVSDYTFEEAGIEFCYYKVNDTWTLFTSQTVMINGGQGWHGFELKVGDTIYDAQGVASLITSIEKVETDTPWVRLQVSGDHGYIVDDLVVHNASRFYITGGVNTNWTTTSNWATISGGSGPNSAPVLGDAVTFDANSTANCVMDTSARACTSVTTANYTHTWTMTFLLVVSGNITIGASHTFGGAANLRINAAGTMTWNKTLGIGFDFGGTTFTCTLATNCTTTADMNFNSTGTLTISGTKTLTGGTMTFSTGTYAMGTATLTENSGGTTLNGSTITIGTSPVTTTTTTISSSATVNGSLKEWRCKSLDLSSGDLSGTATLRFGPSGTGTWTSAGVGTLNNNCTINTSGTLTLESGSGALYGSGTLTYTAGTVVSTGSGLALLADCTLDTSGVTWTTLSNNSATTVTMASDLVATTFIQINGSTMTLSGSFSLRVSSLTAWYSMQGSAPTGIVFTGGGTWNGLGGIITGISITFSGSTTLSTNPSFGSSTMTYSSGTITSTSSTLVLFASVTLDMPGITIANISTRQTGTLTTNSAVNISGTLVCTDGSATWAGTAGWTCGTLQMGANTTMTLTTGNTYSTGATSITGIDSGTPATIQSSVVNGTKATLNLTGTTQGFVWVNAIDIDSSGGLKIISANSTVTRTINWSGYFGPANSSYVFASAG